jgi:hypothetical protein
MLTFSQNINFDEAIDNVQYIFEVLLEDSLIITSSIVAFVSLVFGSLGFNYDNKLRKN